MRVDFTILDLSTKKLRTQKRVTKNEMPRYIKLSLRVAIQPCNSFLIR